jgi:hypothetical protein
LSSLQRRAPFSPRRTLRILSSVEVETNHAALTKVAQP